MHSQRSDMESQNNKVGRNSRSHVSHFPTPRWDHQYTSISSLKNICFISNLRPLVMVNTKNI